MERRRVAKAWSAEALTHEGFNPDRSRMLPLSGIAPSKRQLLLQLVQLSNEPLNFEPIRREINGEFQLINPVLQVLHWEIKATKTRWTSDFVKNLTRQRTSPTQDIHSARTETIRTRKRLGRAAPTAQSLTRP